MNRSITKNKFDPKLYERSGLTEEDIISIKENFDLLDTEKIGTIKVKKIKDLMANKGPQVTSQGVYQLICDLDSEGSGNLTFEQFIHLYTKRIIENDSQQNLKYIFKLFDDEKTGFITIKSLRRKAKELGLDLEQKDFQEMIAAVDIDKDGLISEEQFCQFVGFLTAH